MNTIRMTSKHYSQLRESLLSSNEESVAFLLVGVFSNDNGTHFTVRRIIIPSISDYDNKGRYHVQVSPLFFNKVISLAETERLTVIQCHSHPFAKNSLSYSITDDFGESRSAKTLYDCLNGAPMGSLLFGQNKIIGRIWSDDEKDPKPIDRICILDRHLIYKEIGNRINTVKVDESIHNRQILAFGLKGLQTLLGLKIGIVGLGGTGSSLAEQLAREGIIDYTLADYDSFEKSNKTRLYGSYPGDEGIPKTEIVKRNILRIEPNAKVQTINQKITYDEDLVELKNCDIIFSCLDKHAPRSLLTSFSYRYYIPVIDIGVGLDTENQALIGGEIRATLIGPSLPCLFCIGIINPEVILAESLPDHERRSRQKQGYVSGLGDDVPSVIPFTSIAASYGLILLKDLLFRFLETHSNVVTLNISSFYSSRLAVNVKDDCICQKMLGIGDKINKREKS